MCIILVFRNSKISLLLFTYFLVQIPKVDLHLILLNKIRTFFFCTGCIAYFADYICLCIKKTSFRRKKIEQQQNKLPRMSSIVLFIWVSSQTNPIKQKQFKKKRSKFYYKRLLRKHEAKTKIVHFVLFVLLFPWNQVMNGKLLIEINN